MGNDDANHAREHRDPTRCTACGAVIDSTDWYPVTKRRDQAGDLHIHPFCSESCQTSWLARVEE